MGLILPPPSLRLPSPCPSHCPSFLLPHFPTSHFPASPFLFCGADPGDAWLPLLDALALVTMQNWMEDYVLELKDDIDVGNPKNGGGQQCIYLIMELAPTLID